MLKNQRKHHYSGMIYGALMVHQGRVQSLILCGAHELNMIMPSVMLMIEEDAVLCFCGSREDI